MSGSLILRDGDVEHASGAVRNQILQQVGVPSAPCGSSTDQRPQRVFTLNDGIRPEIPIDPGERQFWRIVNTSPDRYADLQLEGQQLEIVALNGMPLSYHDRTRHTRRVGHILQAPAGRVEAVVTEAAVGTRSSLSTRCVDTGPDGDVNPAMVIADVVSDSHAGGPSHGVPANAGPRSTASSPLTSCRNFNRPRPVSWSCSLKTKTAFISTTRNSRSAPPRCGLYVLAHCNIGE